MTVAIILVNWNGWQDTVECLDTLLAYQTPGVHIFVIDNASNDGSPEYISRWLSNPIRKDEWQHFSGVQRISELAPRQPLALNVVDENGAAINTELGAIVTLVHSGGNLGFAGGNNIGLKLALDHGFDWFWLLNTDTVVRHDTLPELLLRAQADSRCGIVGSSLIYYRKPDYVQAMGEQVEHENDFCFPYW